MYDNGASLQRLECSSIHLSFHDAFQDTCLRLFPLQTFGFEGDIGPERDSGDSKLKNVLGHKGHDLRALKLRIHRIYELSCGYTFTRNISSVIAGLSTLCPSLSSLSFEFVSELGAPIIQALHDLNIPGLRSLLVRGLPFPLHQSLNPCTVLQHNPDIEYLSLPLAKATISPDLLRSLTAFDGSYEDCSQILRIRPSITTLTIDLKFSSLFEERSPDPSPHREVEDILLTGLRGASSLAHLVDVQKDLCRGGFALECGVAREGLERIVMACPNLNSFECLLGSTVDVVDVCPGGIDTLKQLKQLKLHVNQRYRSVEYRGCSTLDSNSRPYSRPSSESDSESETETENPVVKYNQDDMKQRRLEKYGTQVADHLASILPCLHTVNLEISGYYLYDPEHDDDELAYEDSFTYEISQPQSDGSRDVLGTFEGKTKICLGADDDGCLALEKRAGGVAKVASVSS